VGTSRVDLQVPFAEKDDAERLGARWDGGQRTWCIPEGTDPSPFKKWLPLDQPPNIRASRWELAISPRECSVLLGYLKAVPAEVTAQLRRLAPHYPARPQPDHGILLLAEPLRALRSKAWRF
jgi:hypothetical protein